MSEAEADRPALRLAAVDLGSNSFHLVVVDAHADGTFDTLMREKEVLRLGDAVARDGSLSADDIERAVITMRRFVAMANSAGATEIAACATSAIREADNSAAVVDLIEEETGVRVEVISGRREAELIFAAVRASVAIDAPPAVVLDLGGGSLEIAVGDNDALAWATSLKLGAARLTTRFLHNDPPKASELRGLSDFVLQQLADAAARVASFRPGMLVGTSGTFCDLARMAAAVRGGDVPSSVNQLTVERRDIEKVHEELIRLTARDRTKLDGLDARRADQVVAGSTLLLTAMEVLGFDRLTVGEWALREGIILDAIGHRDSADWTGDARAVRRSSAVGLARRCGWNESHARQVARLATLLFDGMRPWHTLDDSHRELLEFAALLHDIGEHVSVEGHHRHTAYLIENGRLRGFTPDEVDVLSTLGRYHRRGEPKPSYTPFDRLDDDRRAEVRTMLALLQVADALDRGHAATVEDVTVELRDGRVRLLVSSTADAELELWGLRRKRDLFEKVFECRLDAAAADHPSVSPLRAAQ